MQARRQAGARPTHVDAEPAHVLMHQVVVQGLRHQIRGVLACADLLQVGAPLRDLGLDP